MAPSHKVLFSLRHVGKQEQPSLHCNKVKQLPHSQVFLSLGHLGFLPKYNEGEGPGPNISRLKMNYKLQPCLIYNTSHEMNMENW
jgi:hypothetical protein